MSPLLIIGIGIGLSMDAFAVAIAASIALGKLSGRQMFRLSFHFGLFQAFMPIIGWFAGRGVGAWIVQWDHWVAFILLLGIGAKAIYEALSTNDDEEDEASDPTRGLKLVGLSTATSIDALAVGLSFALLDVNLVFPCICIGLITGSLTLVGMRMGSRLGLRFGSRVEIIGGLVLIGIGLKILIEHLIA